MNSDNDSLISKRDGLKKERESNALLISQADDITREIKSDISDEVYLYLKDSSYERVIRHMVAAKLDLNDFNINNFCNSMRTTRDTGLRILSKFGYTLDMLNAKKNKIRRIKRELERLS